MDQKSTILCIFIAGAVLRVASPQYLPPIRPIAFRLPNPPALHGPLSANNALQTVERVHQNVIRGPSAFVKHQDSIHTCGQLTSIKLDPTSGHLLALVNFIGLIRVDPSTGAMTLLVSARIPINGRLPVYLTDFVVTSDGTIIMADASDAYTYPNDLYICMDSRPTARLLVVVPGLGTPTEVLSNTFVDPTSLELSPAGDLLVTEACRARVRRVSLQPPTLFQVTDFAINLPGLPDNIRATQRDTYWVAFRHPRHASLPRNPLDESSQSPGYRNMGFNMMSRREMESYMSRWGIVVELDARGQVIGSLHDPHGVTFQSTTEVREFDGVLYIGSDKTNYLGRLVLPDDGSRRVNIDAFLKVLQSRCVLNEADVPVTRARLAAQFPHLA